MPPQQPPHNPPPISSATARMVSVKAAVFCLLLALSTHTGRFRSLLQRFQFDCRAALEAAGTHDWCPGNHTSTNQPGQAALLLFATSALQMLVLAGDMS